MAQRTCDVDGCEQKHLARGMCGHHYRTINRDRQAEYYDRTCAICSAAFRSSRPTGKFCSDACKAECYRITMATKCKLPANHPVMALITEARRRPPVKPQPVLEVRTARECPGCGCWFTPLFKSAGHMTYCSNPCGKREARRRRRAREHNTACEWRWSDFMRIARKFEYCCAYCGVKPDRLDPDHVVPLSRGGADAVSNLLPTCMQCNSDKCAKTLSEWAAWRVERGKPSRMTSWSAGDPRYVHLTHVVLAA